MTTLLELATRCEAATGAYRELDLEIKAAVYGGCAMISPFNGEWCLYREKTDDPRKGKIFERPRSVGHEIWKTDSYTTSLDAAMTLIPGDANSAGEIWSAAEYSDPGVLAPHVRASAWVAGAARVFAATPALALCAAALRARHALNEGSQA